MPVSHAVEGCIDEFVQQLLTDELEVACAYIDSVRVRGVSLSRVYLELLAPAARKLGEMWEEDRVSFADVTLVVDHEGIIRDLAAGSMDSNPLTSTRQAAMPPMKLMAPRACSALSTRRYITQASVSSGMQLRPSCMNWGHALWHPCHASFLPRERVPR